jgi:hypothetical protein
MESGKPPSAIWRAARLLGLYRIWASSLCPSPHQNYITSLVILKCETAVCSRLLTRPAQAGTFAFIQRTKTTRQVIAPELRSVGDTLLAAATEYDAGLLVMGAYSHSRLREMLLGGATRDVLKNATTRPVLMAH